MKSAYFSLWGRHVRGVPVCHTRNIYRFCGTPPFPCHWWLCALLLKCPWHLHCEGEDRDAQVGSYLILSSAGVLLNLVSALGDANRSCQTSHFAVVLGLDRREVVTIHNW